jgi:c-di-AMP phosphodiesterase-like protein
MMILHALLLLFSLILSLTSCSQPEKDKVLNLKNNISNIDTSNFVVITFDQKTNWPFNNSFRPTTLNKEEISDIHSLVNECVLKYNNGLSKQHKENYSIDFKKYTYKMQYVAVLNNKGEKEVWVNGFCDAWNKKWKEEIIFVFDGGNCYFNMKINLTSKNCFDLSVNGYA